MSVPFGQVLVGAVGAVVIGIGIAQIVKGVKQKFTEDLDRGVRPAVRRLGSVGYCVKGIALEHHRGAVRVGSGRPTTRRRPAAWMLPFRQSGSNRSAPCCWRSWQPASPASACIASSGREWPATEAAGRSSAGASGSRTRYCASNWRRSLGGALISHESVISFGGHSSTTHVRSVFCDSAGDSPIEEINSSPRRWLRFSRAMGARVQARNGSVSVGLLFELPGFEQTAAQHAQAF